MYYLKDISRSALLTFLVMSSSGKTSFRNRHWACPDSWNTSAWTTMIGVLDVNPAKHIKSGCGWRNLILYILQWKFKCAHVTVEMVDLSHISNITSKVRYSPSFHETLLCAQLGNWALRWSLCLIIDAVESAKAAHWEQVCRHNNMCTEDCRITKYNLA